MNSESQPNNPLHGITLKALLEELVDHYGWEPLSEAVPINCFKNDPSIKSSLKFLRRTPWAREKVEAFYLHQYKQLPRDSHPSKSKRSTPPVSSSHSKASSKKSDVWANWRNKSSD